MRLGMLLSLAFGLMLSVWSTPSLAAVAGSHGTTVVALQQQPAGGGAQAQPSGKVDVDINVNHNGGGRWYANPLWIAIGALALIVLIALIVMAGRGGGTTVIRD
jgi:amino acid transporter